jgi:AcrR family transcriptional regulator
MDVKDARMLQGAATQKALRRHARRLFTQKGYADASTDELVRRARVTKGALYHHYTNKLELYRAVVEDMERELVSEIEAAGQGAPDPWSRLRAMCRAYLDACDPSVARILVLEAPAVLGWKEWCRLEQRHEVAAFARCLRYAIAAGVVPQQPAETMAQVVLGALNTAARVVATAPNPKAARTRVEKTIERLLTGLRSRPSAA